jgi:putative flippase GtrA
MKQFSRYVGVGIVNTLWSYCIIFALMYLAGLSPEASNAMGYGIGLVTSYALNRSYTFESANPKAPEFLRFIATFALAFAANFTALLLLVHMLRIHAGIAQVAAGVVYVITSYLCSRHFVFRHAK